LFAVTPEFTLKDREGTREIWTKPFVLGYFAKF
jgi:hypothetical protein